MIMRIELALIAGIVCFCCWCAYILINMNSTVAITTQPAQVPPEVPAQVNRHQQQYHQANQFQTNNNNNYELIRQRQLQYGRTGPMSSIAPVNEQFATSTTTTGSALPTSDATSTSVHNSVGHVKPEVANPSSSSGYYTALGQGKLTSAYMQPPVSTAQGQTSNDNRVWHNQPSGYTTSSTSTQNFYPSQHTADLNHWQSVNKQRLGNAVESRNFRHPAYESWPQRNLQTQQEPVAEAQLSSGSYYYPNQEATVSDQGSRWPGGASSRGYYPAKGGSRLRANNLGLQSYYGDDESESEAPTQQQEVAAGQQEGEPGGEDEEDTGQVEADEVPPEDTTTEERVGARSFSEHQLSANERDRHGRPITVHYNHLINGKPVPASSKQVADFESVVNELDPDQEEQQQQRQQRRQFPAGNQEETGQDDYDEAPNAARSSMQSGESRLTGATAKIGRSKLRKANNERGSDDYKLGHDGRLKADSNRAGSGRVKSSKLAPNKPQDSHQHRLSESLTAQQWDDDAASLPSSTTSNNNNNNNNNKNSIPTSQQDGSNINVEPSGDESIANTGENIETTTEAATPEEFVNDEETPDDGADLFAGTDKFPFLDSADSRKRRKRRKRQVLVDDYTRSSGSTRAQSGCSSNPSITKSNSSTRIPVSSKLKLRKNQVAVESEHLQAPEIPRNSPIVKRSTDELSPEDRNWAQSDRDNPMAIKGSRDFNSLVLPSDQLRDNFYHEIEEADRLSEKVGNENTETINNELPNRNQSDHLPQEYIAEVKPSTIFDLTGGMRVKDGDVADTLNSLEDLNIRVMANPSDSSNDDSQQSLVPAPPLPAPPWPPMGASSSNYQTGQSNQPANNYEPHQLPPEVAGPHHQDSAGYEANPGLPVMQNGHSSGPLAAGPPSSPSPPPTNYPTSIRDVANGGYYSSQAPPLASFESHKLHSKKRKKFSKGSKMSKANDMMKYKKAKAHKSKKSSKYNTAGMKKAKKKAKNKMAKSSKQFKGSTRGKKGKLGRGQRGAKKGSLYHKDKGYKKRGFKKVYKKMEAGDNKTYFDEFRDKDHNKKWKNHKDKYHYSQNKDWAGNDMKKYKDFDEHSMKDKKMGSGGLKEKSKSNFKHDYKYKKGSKSKSSSSSKKKKKKKYY